MTESGDSQQERDPEPELEPYRSDPGKPDTERPTDFSSEAWPPPNTGAVVEPEPGDSASR
jgi:hypothetical protein